MNIFGAFTFGSLIKTFLPGFVWLIAIAILVADGAQLLGIETDIWTQAKSKDQAALVLAIPISILLGLLSNVIVFMGVNDWLVRDRFPECEPELSTLHEALKQRIREQCWSALAPQHNMNQARFLKDIDPEIILLERLGVEKTCLCARAILVSSGVPAKSYSVADCDFLRVGCRISR